MTYDESMLLYGCDKPDLRFGLPLIDLTPLVQESAFGVFRSTAEAGGSVRGVRYPGGGHLSRKDVGQLEDFCKEFGAKGMASFSIGDEVLTSTELDTFLARADDIEYVKTTLRHALTVLRRSGGTKAAVWLGELTTHAERVDFGKIEGLLTALFEIADGINVEADAAKAFSIGNNELRFDWLLGALTRDARRLTNAL